MPPTLPLQLFASAVIVVAVLFFMWRLPRRGEAFFGWAPLLGLGSAWGGLLAAAGSGLLWVVPYPDRWVALLFLAADPAAITAGTLVLWIYRGHEGASDTIEMQRLQARIGIVLGLLAVAIGYAYVMTHKPIDI